LANHTGGRLRSSNTSGSEKLVEGTTQRLGTSSQRRQCELLVLRTLVTPGSGSVRFSSSMSTSLPLVASFSARFGDGLLLALFE